MAHRILEIPYSVFLPGKMKVTQADLDYQVAHGGDFNCVGLNTMTIALMIVVTVAVLLRLLSRKIAKIGWRADDYTLVLGWLLSMGAQACSLNITYNGGFCRHTYTNNLDRHRFEQFGKTAYAWNVLYTTSYPVSRISLVLLYQRVFIQKWVKITCWVVIFCYIGYALGSMTADLTAALPVASNWNPDVMPTRQIDGRSLFIANSGFNIATDAILLILPLIVIWSLNRDHLYKIGLSAIFCLGVLTVVASIARLVYYYQFDQNDPLWGLPDSQYWTIAEMNLGLLCPCLVTFGPLIRSGILLFSSNMSPSALNRLERLTGMQQTSYTLNGDASTNASESKADTDGVPLEELHRPKPARLESARHMAGKENAHAHVSSAGVTGIEGQIARDSDGMAIDQDEALAYMDPRARARYGSKHNGSAHQRMGTSTSVVGTPASEVGMAVPMPKEGIGVTKELQLGRE